MKKGGFTLIELLISLAVIGILSGIIMIPFIFGNRSYRTLKESARILASDLIWARMSAIKESIYYDINFFPGTGNKPWEYSIKRETRELKIVKKLLSGIYISNTNLPGQSVRFYPNGSPSSGGTIILEDTGGQKIYIKIEAAVGRIRVSESGN